MRYAFAIILALCMSSGTVKAQEFTLEAMSDTLHYVVLTTDSTEDRWCLPYPVYQFQVGDIDGNGLQDAVVGVVKATRFYPQPARRLFIFKNFHGKVRPMWMGSHLGGILEYFRVITVDDEEGATRTLIRSLQTTKSGRFVVADYRWQGFGMGFERFVVKTKEEAEAMEAFYADE